MSSGPPAEGTGNCSTGPDPYNKASFPNIMMFLTISAIVGALVQGMAPKRVLKLVPQPIVVLLLFVVVGVVTRLVSPQYTEMSVRAVVDPIMIQSLFLPILMCSELFRLNTRAFFIVLFQLLCLVIPGVIIGALLTSVYTFAIMPSRPLFSFSMSMAFGGMLATTDPIAVIICVNEMAAPKRLAAVVGGESLLNDGTSIVITTLFITLVNGGEVTADWLVFFIFNQLLFSILFGTAMGFASLALIRVVRNDSSTFLTLIVTIPFLTFVVSTYFFDSSGVLSVIPLCIVLNEYGRGVLMEHVDRIEKLFDNLAFIATGWLYALCGFLVGEVIASDQITGMDWLSLFLLYIWINFVRLIMIGIFFPVLKYTGYGFSVREAILLIFGGLRGAVGLTLALFINAQVRDSDPRGGALTEFFMCGIIFLMMINAILTPVLLRKLKLDSKPNKVLMEALQQKMGEECADTLLSVGVKYEAAHMLAFGTTAQEVKMSRRRFEFKAPTEEGDEDTSQLGDNIVKHRLTQQLVNLGVLVGQRKHLVRAQRQMYESLLKRKLISRAAWHMLDRAADAQLEVNYFYLDQYSFVLDQAFNSKRFKLISKSQPSFFTTPAGRLLAFLRSKGELPAEHFMKRSTGGGLFGARNSADVVDAPDLEAGHDHPQSTAESRDDSHRKRDVREPLLSENDDGEDIMEGEDSKYCLPGLGDVSRTIGMPVAPEEWLFSFALASWGFIVAQKDSTKLVDEMFTISPELIAFYEERQSLKVEIQEGCALPALFLDACAQYYPDVLRRIKSLHALSEAGNRLFGSVATLASHGLIERQELKRLLRFAEKGLKRIRNCEIELEEPISVGPKAVNLMLNPNFFPFPRPESVSMGMIGLRSAGFGDEEDEENKSIIENIPEHRPLALDVSSGALDSSMQVAPPVSLGAKHSQLGEASLKRQLSMSKDSGSIGGHPGFRSKAPRKLVMRRRSYGDFDELYHRIEDGSEVTFMQEPRINFAASGEHRFPPTTPGALNETMLTDYLLTSSMHPMDITRLKDVLKLDDAELKRY